MKFAAEEVLPSDGLQKLAVYTARHAWIRALRLQTQAFGERIPDQSQSVHHARIGDSVVDALRAFFRHHGATLPHDAQMLRGVGNTNAGAFGNLRNRARLTLAPLRVAFL